MNKKKYYVLSFLIPAALMLVVFIFLKMYPFGEKSILVADMRYQFIDYLAYFKTIFTENNDFFYTFSKSLGGDMLGLSSYYLQNPFNLFLLLFSNEMLPVGIMLIIILQSGFSGLCFNIYLNNISKPRLASLIFSTAYSFIAFYVAYINCIIYFFNIAILPLVILGIYRLINNPKKRYLYIFTLSLSLFTNYYLGYMVCIFSVIYFTLAIVEKMEHIKDIIKYKDQIISFTISSLLAGGIAAFSLLPTLFSLSGEKSGIMLSKFSISRKFHMSDLFSNLYSHSFNGNISDGLPLIYAGILGVVLVLLYLVNKNVSIKKRVIAFIFFCIILINFYIYALDLVWHGFNQPIGFPYRNSFIFSFVLLHYAYCGFQTITQKNISLRNCVAVLSVYALYSLYVLLFRKELLSISVIIFNLIFVIVYLGIFYFGFKNKRMIMISMVLLFSLQCIDITSNAVSSIDKYQVDSMQEYLDSIDNTQKMVNQIKESDPTFFRMEKTYRRTHNDAMQYNYNGLSHFSSTQKDEPKEFLSKLGLRYYGDWVFYNDGSTSFVDSLLGIKYLLSQWNANGRTYNQIFESDQYYAYENPYALSVGFGITEDILHVNMENDNLFEIQNEIADSFSHKKNEIYMPANIKKPELENLQKNENVYQKIDLNKDAYLIYHITIEQDNILNMYFSAPGLQEGEIYINDWNKGSYFSKYDWDIAEIGQFKPGEQITLKIKVTDQEIVIDHSYFYYENRENFCNWYNESEINQWEAKKISSSHLKGDIEITEPNQYMLFSIPYEDSWTIKIDGKKTEPVKMLNALLGVKIDSGVHNVEINYIPKGLYLGVIISLSSIFMVGIMMSKNLSKK